jgi:hypothetical protein
MKWLGQPLEKTPEGLEYVEEMIEAETAWAGRTGPDEIEAELAGAVGTNLGEAEAEIAG